MKKALGLLLLGVTSCLQVGDVFAYHMARNRTSNVIRDTKVKLEVVDDIADATVFKLNVFIQPIVGKPNDQERSLSVDKALTTLDTLESLRKGEVLEGDVRVQHEGFTDGGCDKLLVDKIPDTADTKDMVVHITLCGADDGNPNVPAFDVEVTAQGMLVQLGYDLTI